MRHHSRGPQGCKHLSVWGGRLLCPPSPLPEGLAAAHALGQHTRLHNFPIDAHSQPCKLHCQAPLGEHGLQERGVSVSAIRQASLPGPPGGTRPAGKIIRVRKRGARSDAHMSIHLQVCDRHCCQLAHCHDAHHQGGTLPPPLTCRCVSGTAASSPTVVMPRLPATRGAPSPPPSPAGV